ncbi:MAG: DNA-processing protein DprA, partial [bacterium]|nr:DNA-processing protein DprA [bacterium]
MVNNQQLIIPAIAACPSIGPRAYAALRSVFNPITDAWTAPKAAFHETGLSPKVVDTFIAHRAAFDFDAFAKLLERTHVSFATIDDDDYPELLKQIFDPPIVLYYRGALRQSQGDNLLSVVGTRKATDYGIHVTRSLTEELVRAGITIVSGLALGIDAVAHQTTVDHQGKTIAVLAGGVDAETVAPRTNAQLAERIIETGGALVSEYPPGTAPRPEYFPQRNRIIAGLCIGTIVTEAPIESGALITAKCAREENREVFAVPGNITYENSTGTNLLIKLGAHCVTEAQDILDILG